mgnify:CR=1 FL=1
MKKLLAFLLGIMVMATMIAGCGGGGKKKDKKTSAQKIN